MKTKIIMSLIVITFITISSIYSQSVGEKVDNFKETIEKMLADRPRLGFFQKISAGRIIRAARPSIREDAEKIRSLILKMRHEFRQQLTREQLLQMMEMQDHFVLYRPGVKLAVFLQRLDPAERVEFVNLMRELKKGESSQISANLDKIFLFFQTKVHPKWIKQLSLNSVQQRQLENMIREGRPQIKEVMVQIIQKLYIVRDLVKKILTPEQITYLEINKEKIFQEIIRFVHNL